MAYDVEKIQSQGRRITQSCLNVVVVRTERSGKDRFLVGSGFVVKFEDQWLWITADHCISVFAEIEAKESAKFYFLVPHSGGHALEIKDELGARIFSCKELFHKLNFEPSAWGDTKREWMALLAAADVAVCLLGDDVRERLGSLGLMPLERHHINLEDDAALAGADRNDFELMVFGIPMNSLRQDSLPDNPQGVFKMLPLKMDHEPDGLRCFARPCWDNQHKGSIKGMSGGPIAVLGWDYPKVVAVQSQEIVQDSVAEDPDDATPELLVGVLSAELIWFFDIVLDITKGLIGFADATVEVAATD